MKRYKIGDIVDFEVPMGDDGYTYRLGGKITEIRRECSFPIPNTWKWKKATGYTVEVQFSEVLNWAPEDDGEIGQSYLLEYHDLLEHDASRFHPGVEDDTPTVICNKWIPCTDENYWLDPEDGYYTIVQVCFDVCDVDDNIVTEKHVFTRGNCPYGWSTLIKNNAKLMNIEL